MLRLINAVTGDFHHPVGQGCTDHNTDSGYEQHCFEGSGFGSDSGVQKIDSVVTDSDHEVEYGERK